MKTPAAFPVNVVMIGAFGWFMTGMAVSPSAHEFDTDSISLTGIGSQGTFSILDRGGCTAVTVASLPWLR